MRYALAKLSLRMLKPSLLVIDLLLVSVSGVLTFSCLMLFPFPRWFASLRLPLRTVSASLCTLSSKASYSISMYPNFWGVLVDLLVFFRDKGLGVPSIALLLDLFSVKEASEGFLYISKRATARPIISDLPSSHKHWKECYFFVGGRHWEYDPADRDDSLGIPTVWTPLRTSLSFLSMLVRVDFLKVTLCSQLCFGYVAFRYPS